MKKHFSTVTIILLCIVLVNIPLSLYGQDWWRPDYAPDGAVLGTIHLGQGMDWDFVGVKYEKDLWSAGHAAWGIGPDLVTKIIHPDPNVNPAIKNWMRKNKVDWAVTYYGDVNDGFFVVTRHNHGTDENEADAYSTLYYGGGR